MTKRSQIIHDLALVYAEQKYREFLNSAPPESRVYPAEISELVRFYTSAVAVISNMTDEIEQSYVGDEKDPIYSFD